MWNIRKGINISHVNIENMGGCDQSQVKIKFEKFKKVKSVPKTYQKVITITDVNFWDEVCQNLIKSNKVSGDRSGYTYLRLPSKGKGICKVGAAPFMIFWWWVAGWGHQNLLRLGRNGEGLKVYTYLVFTPKNKGPKCKGSHPMGDFWWPKRVGRWPDREVWSTVGIHPEPKLGQCQWWIDGPSASNWQ